MDVTGVAVAVTELTNAPRRRRHSIRRHRRVVSSPPRHLRVVSLRAASSHCAPAAAPQPHLRATVSHCSIAAPPQPNLRAAASHYATTAASQPHLHAAASYCATAAAPQVHVAHTHGHTDTVHAPMPSTLTPSDSRRAPNCVVASRSPARTLNHSWM